MADNEVRSTRQLLEIGSRSTTRRGVLKGGTALGLSAVAGQLTFGRYSVSAQDSETLSFYHDKSPWQDFYKQMGDLAEAAVGVNWDPTAYSDTTSYQAAVLAALPTKETPDFFTWWSGYRMEDLQSQGVLEDVSDIWAQAISDGNLPESLSSAFTFDGKQYALPGNVSYWGVFYNKKVFADNGIEVPTTWADFIAACDTVKAAGVTPMASTQVGRWPSFILFEELVLRTDPGFYTELTAGRAKYTDAPAVKAMETWRTMIEAEYFTSFDTDMANDWPGMFAQGTVAMIPIGTWYQSNFTAADMKPGDDYGVFIMPNTDPAVTEKVAIVETGAMGIASNSQKLDATKTFGNWWVTPEAQTTFANLLGDTPANPKAQSDNPVLKDLLSTLNTEGYTLFQRYWEASPVPIVEGAVDFLAEFMLNPDQAESVLQNIQDLADTEWAKRGGPARAAGATPTS
jgi:multiple sugar transport system substrate-binding protein